MCVFWRIHLPSLQKLWLRLRDPPLVSDPELLKSLWTRDLWVQPEQKMFQNVRMFSLKQHILKKIKKKEKKLPLPSRWPWKSASRFPSNSLKMLKHHIRQQKYSQKFPLSHWTQCPGCEFFFFFNMFQKVQKKKRERQGSSYHGAKRESTSFFFSFLYYLFVFICEITSRNLLSIWTNHRDDDSKKKKLILLFFRREKKSLCCV